MDKLLSFKFIEKYSTLDPPFKNHGLGEFVYYRTYSRIKDDGNNEQWYETIQRVVEGTFNLKKNWFLENNIMWNIEKETKYAETMYDLMFHIKFLPGGRGLWSMGTKVTETKHLYAALNNCAFVSTKDIDTILSEPFTFMMDASMLGVGVGFDTVGAGKIIIHEPIKERTIIHRIEDSREGWIYSLKLLLESYFLKDKEYVDFDFSGIRPAGQKLSHFGGTSSGPEPLIHSYTEIRKVLNKNVKSVITSRTIVDIMNLVGLCVVSGNIRRSASIAIGDAKDNEFINLKNYGLYPERMEYGWLSNNSINAEIGMNYIDVAKCIQNNGEPGIVWLDNMKMYSRMNGIIDNKDNLIQGSNPCMEMSLEDRELCCVSGDTMIQTRTGIYPINILVNKDVEIFNGKNWSIVKPFIAGYNKNLYRVWISDGSYLDCTDDHYWQLAKENEQVYNKTSTKNIQLYDVSVPWNLTSIRGESIIYAYAYGSLLGIGHISTNHFLNETICEKLLNKSRGLPSYFFEMDEQSILNFIAGIIDTCGEIYRHKNIDSFRFYNTEKKIRDIQLLLRRAGINNAIIYNIELISDTKYCCHIPSFECIKIPTLLKKLSKIDTTFTIFPQKIIKVEKLDGKHTTYCFTEHETHMGVFNNVLTFQCLVEIFIHRNKSLDEFLNTLKYAFMYAKTVTLGQTHWKKTNDVIKRNRRVGTSLTGITNFIAEHNIAKLKFWCEKGYEQLKLYDSIISKQYKINESIKITSIKPSGTISNLAPNTCPGIHYSQGKYYIRRVRIQNQSNIIKVLSEQGYPIEKAIHEPNTSIISFPINMSNIRTVKEVSLMEQLELIAFVQQYWADNQISCTVTFNPITEGHIIANALNFYQYRLKGVSFLPLISGKYDQMPYEEISEIHYNDMNQKIVQKKQHHININETDHVTDLYCTTDHCVM